MTKEKYVASIIRRLNLPKKTRERIRQDLLQDIQTAVEEGQTLEEVMARMGTPEEAAQEFNESYGDMSEKSGWTRILKIIFIAAIVLSSLYLIFNLIILLVTASFGMSPSQNVGIIGGADGPTAIFITSQYEPLPTILKLIVSLIVIFLAAVGIRKICRRT